jgi:hypothetical protein
MAKCNRQTHPELFAYLEAYGLDTDAIARIDRIKENGHYAVVGWPNSDGMVELLDLSPTPDRMSPSINEAKADMSSYGWNMLNDGMNAITEKDWNKVRLDEYCENFTIAGHEDYG